MNLSPSSKFFNSLKASALLRMASNKSGCSSIALSKFIIAS